MTKRRDVLKGIAAVAAVAAVPITALGSDMAFVNGEEFIFSGPDGSFG